MGKIPFLTREQKIILDEVAHNDFLRERFYFTGGTALSLAYLKHRYSEDLDFFSERDFDDNIVTAILTKWSRKHKFTYVSEFVEVVLICTLRFDKAILKIDFGHYPYQKLEKGGEYRGLYLDSMFDIAANKVHAITRRAQVKDFVDLYFLLQKYSVWDLIEAVRIKFNSKLEPLILASDLLTVDDFDQLPRMTIPLTLHEMKRFFRLQAQKLGHKVTI